MLAIEYTHMSNTDMKPLTSVTVDPASLTKVF